MKLSSLVTSAAIAATPVQAEDFSLVDPFRLYPLSPEVAQFNETVPQALIDLQTCVRERFEGLGVVTEDGSTIYILTLPLADSEKTYDITFPNDLAAGITSVGIYETQEVVGVDGETFVSETTGEAVNFEFPVSQESLFREGMFAQIYPERFQSNHIGALQRRVANLSRLCESGRLQGEDFAAQYAAYWESMSLAHQAARDKLSACLQYGPADQEALQIILEAYSGPIDQFNQLGFEQPEDVIYELDQAYALGCAES
ncbi:hypothetical protein GW756_05490 [bacterium]|nr:hypothetical protein [bacterium]NCQ55321.1 hypothetical protein [Candidatus Parcubacteria bacterium]NCS67166.1 hypothetical protein [Candidatus Peregrinibacteria bacterium]NCS96792.1 hypothetical protein [bacterium]